MNNETRTPNAIDIHVGRQIRQARRAGGFSQQALADALGLTFQQVQKYEGGANRISASKLYATAQKLDKPVAWFFEGLDEVDEVRRPIELAMTQVVASPEGAELITFAAKLKRPIIAKLAGIARAVVETEAA